MIRAVSRNVSVESEDRKDVSETFRDTHPGFDGVDGLGRLRAHLMGVNLGLAMGGSRSSPFSVKNSSCLAEDSVEIMRISESPSPLPNHLRAGLRGLRMISDYSGSRRFAENSFLSPAEKGKSESATISFGEGCICAGIISNCKMYSLPGLYITRRPPGW